MREGLLCCVASSLFSCLPVLRHAPRLRSSPICAQMVAELNREAETPVSRPSGLLFCAALTRSMRTSGLLCARAALLLLVLVTMLDHVALPTTWFAIAVVLCATHSVFHFFTHATRCRLQDPDQKYTIERNAWFALYEAARLSNLHKSAVLLYHV